MEREGGRRDAGIPAVAVEPPWAKRLRSKLRLLMLKVHVAAASREGEVLLGASRHRFKLNPPLASGALEALESTHRLALPDDYRQFLLLIGNGGLGPNSGVRPLEEVLSLVPPGALSREFPAGGSLPLSEFGTGVSIDLVVRGKERGFLWARDPGPRGGLFPVTPNDYCNWIHHLGTGRRPVKRLRFLDWYEGWMDDSLHRLMRSLSEMPPPSARVAEALRQGSPESKRPPRGTPASRR